MKNVDRERDRAIERLLPETLRAHGATTVSDACLDAEIAAAWADDTLGPHERSVADAHAANCARCQALLAALVRTSPPTAAPAWFRRRTLAWAIPMTAAATAVIVWTIQPSRRQLAPAARPASNVDVAATAPAAPPIPSRPPAQPKALASASPAPKPEAGSAAQKQELRARSFADASRAADAPPPVLPAPLAAPAMPAPSAVNKAVPPATTAESTDRTVASPAATGAAAPSAARSESRLLARRFDAAASQPLIVSTDPSHRWLIAANGLVWHSIDGGSTWETQETGASATLTAGASPAPSICWLVGPSGTVVRSTDGRSWQVLPFEEKVDLVSIRATDEKTATVTAADRRTFTTTDGGLTWTPR